VADVSPKKAGEVIPNENIKESIVAISLNVLLADVREGAY